VGRKGGSPLCFGEKNRLFSARKKGQAKTFPSWGGKVLPGPNDLRGGGERVETTVFFLTRKGKGTGTRKG